MRMEASVRNAVAELIDRLGLVLTGQAQVVVRAIGHRCAP